MELILCLITLQTINIFQRLGFNDTIAQNHLVLPPLLFVIRLILAIPKADTFKLK